MCMNIEFKRCCSLPMYVLYNNICVWMTTTKNFAIKLSRRTSYVTLSGKCVYCLINFVLLKKNVDEKMNGVSEFSTFVPYVLLCPILKQPEIVQENIHIVPKLFSVWPKFCTNTYLVWLVSVPYCLQILGVLGKNTEFYSAF